jgi:hypothetical protein
MPVVINEFEVIPESSAGRQTGGDQKPAADKSSALTLQDVVEIMKHQLERNARVWAH